MNYCFPLIKRIIGIIVLSALVAFNTSALASLGSLFPQYQPPSSTTTRNLNEFILPDSDNRLYTEDEIRKLNDHNLNLAINEIYARRGLTFEDPELDSYFRSKSWYNPIYTFADFEAGGIFNAYEQQNIVTLAAERDRRSQ